MILTRTFSRVAVPHGIQCPYAVIDANGVLDHKAGDVLSELFELVDKESMRLGQAAMLCPNCEGEITFPKGWVKDPIKNTGKPLVWWSQAIWDSYDQDRKDYVRGNVPNVEKFLR